MDNKPTNLLDYIELVITLAKENGLSRTFFEKARTSLQIVAVTLGITEIQACLFSLILENSGSEAASFSDIADTYKCSRVQLYKYLYELEALEKKKMIRPVYGESFLRKRRKNDSPARYKIPLDVIKALHEGRPYKDTSYQNLSPEDFFAAAHSLFEDCEDSNISHDTFEEELKALLASNKKNAFTQNLAKKKFNFMNTVVLLYLCCLWTEDNIEAISLSRLQRIIGLSVSKTYIKRIRMGDNPLLEAGLLEPANDSPVADRETWQLSNKAHETFLSDVNLSERKPRNDKNLIRCSRIAERRLFHPEKINSRIDELTELLQDDNFIQIKKRLAEMEMRTAFTCLFQGPPGTGKTETAYQLARKTNRDIYLVDISDIKSMWFGESEKKIKALFDRYKGLLKGNRPAPILLFNEADAVLGKRQELTETRRGPAHTENAIQNIILQEMETLEGGILIATTNMMANLDKAFDRRFLYKLEFEKPDTKTAAAIWQNFFPSLAEEDALTLAARYDLSGGQIENVSRKNTVSFLLKGSETTTDNLAVLCKEELSDTAPKRIGFCT